MDIQKTVHIWVTANKAEVPPEKWYCPTRDIFSARLSTLLSKLERSIGENAYLLTAVIGEIGNNSFDHNLGNWLDIPGIFFAYDLEQKMIVLADRGQGILKTIQRVKPEVKTHADALRVAFTEVISGRAPERRGNGLKFVAQTIRQKNWRLVFDSGDARIMIRQANPLQISQTDEPVNGCYAVIEYTYHGYSTF